MKTFIKLLIIRLIMNLADSIFYIALLWFVSDNYDSNYYLGIFFSILMLPDLFLIFWGPIIDRHNPRSMLIGSILVQVLALGVFIVFHQHMNFVMLMALAFTIAMASSVSYVLEDTLIPRIVERNQIVLANSLFSISYKVLDSIFNSISSISYTIVGLFVLLNINALVFIVALIFVLFLKIKYDVDEEEEFNFKTYRKELSEGIGFIKNNSLLLSTTLVLVFINFFTAIQKVSIPIFSKVYFDGAVFYGLVLTIMGIGGIIGNFLAPIVINKLKPYQVISGFLVLTSISWLLAVLLQNYYLTLLFLGFISVSQGIYNIVFESFYQQIPPIKLVGRVNSAIDSIITLGMPIGSFIAGFLLAYDLRLVMILAGIPMLLSGYIFYRHKQWREFEIE